MRIAWLGHLEIMPEDRINKRITEQKPIAFRFKKKLKREIWKADFKKDLKFMNEKNWKKQVINKSRWLSVIEQVKNQQEL